MGFGGHMFGGWGFNPGFYLFNGGSWWVWLIAMGLQLLFWGALIWIGVRLFRSWSKGQGARTETSSTAYAILRERYARGEIDTEEYLRRKQNLE